MAYNPPYYTRGSIECWDYIRDQRLSYHLGCAIKYITRAGHKDSKIKDLEKAIHYLENELQHTRSEEKSKRSSSGVPGLVWNPELLGCPDYATGFDR